MCVDCISESNGQHGFSATATEFTILNGCDAYNNGGSGYNASGTGEQTVINCNFVKNGIYGVANGLRTSLFNCGFGSGTQANTSGPTQFTPFLSVNPITYASGVTPWVAPTTGNFSINLAAAENTGRGSFTETGSGKTGTVGYPDVGAAAHKGGGGGGNILRSSIIEGLGVL